MRAVVKGVADIAEVKAAGIKKGLLGRSPFEV